MKTLSSRISCLRGLMRLLTTYRALKVHPVNSRFFDFLVFAKIGGLKMLFGYAKESSRLEVQKGALFLLSEMSRNNLAV